MEQKRKKIGIYMLAFLTAVIFTLLLLPGAAQAEDMIASGSCGDDLEWTLTADGQLTISGDYNMSPYRSASAVPWYSHRSKIKKAVIASSSFGSVSDYAFQGCTNLEEVDLQGEILSIGSYAFDGCSALQTLSLTKSVTTINSYAFRNCSTLQDVYYAGSVEDWLKMKIQSSPAEWTRHFYFGNGRQELGEELLLPSSVTTLPNKAFYSKMVPLTVLKK